MAKRRWSVALIRHRFFLWRRSLTCERAFVILCVSLTALLVLMAVSTAPQAVHKLLGYDQSKPPLQATVLDGEWLRFKILQVPDMHYTGDPNYPCRDPPYKYTKSKIACTESKMTEFISHLLDSERPDFVVFTGDQIESFEIQHTRDEVIQAMNAATKQVIDRKIPWAMVFGNHDEGQTMSKSEMFAYLDDLPYSYSKFGPREIGGVGNYQLHVEAPEDGPWYTMKRRSTKPLLRFYFMDSHNGLFTPHQIEFATEMSATAFYEHIPALMFFHNPIPEYKLFDKVLAAPDGRMLQGQRLEKVSHGDYNSGMFEAMKQMNDVKAVFVGHDHFNDYCFYLDPLHLCYGGGVGYGAAYGYEHTPRRARIIEWNWNRREEVIETWLHEDPKTGGTLSTKYEIYRETHEQYPAKNLRSRKQNHLH